MGGGWYVRGVHVQFPPAAGGGPGWPALVIALAAGMAVAGLAVAVQRRRVRRRWRKMAGPGLPDDGRGCMSPCMEDRWYDLAARYDEQTAAEPAYSRRPR